MHKLLFIALYCASQVATAQACSIASNSLAFGIYDPFSSVTTDTASSISVVCQSAATTNVSYTIKLDGGLSGSISARNLTGPGTNLAYQLYRDVTRAAIWGDGSAGSSSVSDSYTLITQVPSTRSYAIFGRINPRQNIKIGAYSDTVTVLISY